MGMPIPRACGIGLTDRFSRTKTGKATKAMLRPIQAAQHTLALDLQEHPINGRTGLRSATGTNCGDFCAKRGYRVGPPCFKMLQGPSHNCFSETDLEIGENLRIS